MATSKSAPDVGAAVGQEDFSLVPVPPSERYSWWKVAVQRFGQLSALSQFLIGATLGMGMSFWDAILAITLGSVMLELVTIFTGIVGVKEGMSTSVVARWTGFGRGGSALVALVIAVSSVGWFGVQNAIFAESLNAIVTGPPVWFWSLVGGIGVTVIVVYGFVSMTWTALITVPAFVVLAVYTIGQALTDHDLRSLISSDPPGEPLSLAAATTVVAGGFIVGAIFTPDMTRFNRTTADVVKQTVVGVTLGEYVICTIGVLLAHAARTSDVVAIVVGTSGIVGALVLIVSVVKVNDWNLYPSSLATVNAIDVLFGGRKVSRVAVTWALGLAGTALSALGIMSGFVEFLSLLGVVVPPVAGVMIAEYFIVRRWRPELRAARERGELPASAPDWVPAGLVVWAGAAVFGYVIDIGIPAINSIAIAIVLYAVLGKIGLTGGYTRRAS